MRKKGLIAVALMLYVISVSGQMITISSEMSISRTTKFKKAVYKIDGPPDSSKAVVNIEGDNIVVDFNGAELRGDVPVKRPDKFIGIAIYIRNSKNVTIKNLKARGYKVALIARNTEKLTIENCDFSYNYRPQLNSTQEKEDISDWMSYHHNEKDEWLRYGAAMYLKDCSFFTVRNCKVTGGQNALMMMRCNDGLIVNNDFSFNSGIGIGMYRSSRNRVIYNRVIFNVRGYSHGVYNRGQDSAGMLVYEQSSSNIFYKNNVTHGGDGFFLWAGQTTMDTGKGGCNDNLLFGNDFSYAPTNGIEVTFSRNYISTNILNECDHGIWGGYSFGTTIKNNKFKNNRIGIAIEHGQYNHISMNMFEENKEAIRLWARKMQPADWGYAKKRDTRSKNYFIYRNYFDSSRRALNITYTDSLLLHENKIAIKEIEALKKDSTLSNVVVKQIVDSIPFILTADRYWDFFDIKKRAGKPIKIPDSTYAGRKNILITEWGPYDFRYPIIWNTNPTDTSAIMKFDLLGPTGNWQIKSIKGLRNVSANRGVFPAVITAEKIKGDRTDIVMELEYKGAAIVTALGETITAGKASKFYFKKFFQPFKWEVLFYRLDTASHNPIATGMLFSMYERKAPFKTEKKDRLEYAWWGGIKEAGIQYPQFITVADGTAAFQPGNYELSVTWDDAVRVYVDEKLVLDEWNPSRYTFDESPNKKVKVRLSGNHNFRVEHVELGGFATLSLKIKPVE
ncbi:MAG: right-handed parallel beta-helix repeat-containing protein [Bacteroidota bacterium]